MISKAATNKAIHFPGLNAFRFLAAALVVLVHVEDARQHLHVTAFSLHLPESTGGLAVTFFFVLSGFLITFLLLQEKQQYGTISIKKFYWRRILRIWPLYYLIVALAFLVLNNPTLFSTIADLNVHQKAPSNLLLYLLLLPNIAWITNRQILYANQLWSVGVEEQFYAFWPLTVKYLGRRSQLYFMIGLIVALVVVRNGASFLAHHPVYSFLSVAQLDLLGNFLTVTRLSCMAIGGLGAYAIYFHPTATQRWISSTLVDALVVATVLLICVTNAYLPYVMYEAFAVLFCYIILSCSCKANSILTFENRLWRWLGNLSYGIYMWHMIVLGLVLYFLDKKSISSSLSTDIVLYVGVLPLTIIISWLSYTYIEKPFLQLKKRFVVVDSRP